MKLDLERHLGLFPNSAVQIVGGRLYGCWMIGNNFKAANGYYGEYPPGFVARVKSLFSPFARTLHLFSGSMRPQVNEVTFDINPDCNPTVCGDSAKLREYFWPKFFDLIIADPPYSKKDAERYGHPMPNVWKTVRECYEILIPGGYLVWLSTRAPMYSKKQFRLAGLIQLYTGTNRLYRGVMFLERQNDGQDS